MTGKHTRYMGNHAAGLRRYYGLCLMEDGSEAVLEVEASSEAEASQKLHTHGVMLVLEFVLAEKKEKAKPEKPVASSAEPKNKQPLNRYFGLCLMEDGSEVVLVAKASSEAEACRHLHEYAIVMVLDLLPAEEYFQRRYMHRPGTLSFGVPNLI